MKKFEINSSGEERNNDIFKRNTMDYLLQDRLKEDMSNVRMSHSLKESIMGNTIKKPMSLYEKFSRLLNSTVEISVSHVCTVCFVIFISSTLSTFIVTDSMKMNKNLQGYSNIRVLNISGSNVILPKGIGEVINNEKN